MKSNSPKRLYYHNRSNSLLIITLSLIGILFPTKTTAAIPVFLVLLWGKIVAIATSAEALTALCAGATLIITLWDHRGQFEVEQSMRQYIRKIKTEYRGVIIDQKWIADFPDGGGNAKYYYECKSENFSDKTTYWHQNNFSIAEHGSTGDVPLEVRNSRCEYWVEDDYSEPNRMTQRLFSYSNQTEFHIRCKLSWKTIPWSPPQAKRVTLTLNNWTPELQACDEASRYRSTSASFPGEVPANGSGSIPVRSRWQSGSMINLSHGEGAGIAIN